MSTSYARSANATDLIRFLLARIEEDDFELRVMRRRRATEGIDPVPGHGARSLDRLIADCRAKRDVVGHAQQLLVLRDQPMEQTVRDEAVKMLRALALPYRAHQGFREQWLYFTAAAR